MEQKVENIPSATEKCNISQNLKVYKHFAVVEGTFLLFLFFLQNITNNIYSTDILLHFITKIAP